MRKISLLLSTLLLAALLLTACGGGEETTTAAPATDVATEMPTEAPTEAATEAPVGTETVMPGEGTGTPGIPVTGENDPSRLSNQINFDVWNQNGEQIGEVNDMILDLDNARVAYVIVGTGGFLEIGEKDVLVPWNQLEVQTAAGGPAGDQNAFILNADQALFENAPDLDLDAVLPGSGQSAGDWDAEIRTYWESGVVPATAGPNATASPEAAVTDTASPEATATTTSPEATEPPGVGELQGVVLASDVLGASVTLSLGQGEGQGSAEGTGQATATPGTATDATATVDPNAPAATAGPGVGNFNGTIDDMITDIDTGDILYIVVHADFDEGERWIPIPLSFFGWDAANDTFVINANPAMLRDAPFFQDGQFPDTTAEGWNSEFDTFWQSGGAGTGSGGGAEATATPG